jgi:hypothetical protein
LTVPEALKNLIPTRPEPAVWISRVLLLSSIRPLEVIREIKLGRGLNIIWGMDEDHGAEDEVIVAGHGVGKTSFCRLLRYCLGESTFGSESSRERIREAFSQGYVAAEMNVGGKRWAVARPIGRSPQHYAGRNTTIEKMVDAKEGRIRYEEFRQALEDTALADLTAGMTVHTGQQIKWDHLLAWCARDQEARYQSIWQWRSPRSDSKTPTFNRPKEDGLFLIRTVLGLLSGEEAKLQEQHDKIEKDLADLEKQITEAKREPEYMTRFLAQGLANLIGIEDFQQESAQEESLFDMRVQGGAFRQKLETRVREIGDKCSSLDGQILDVSSKLNDLDGKLEFNNALLNQLRGAAEDIEKGAEQRASEKQKLDSIQNSMCTWGKVLIKDCSYFKGQLNVLSLTQALDDKKDAETAKKKKEAIKQIEGEINRLAKQRAELDRNKNKLQGERSALENERRASERKVEQASSLSSELDKYRAIRDGKEPNTKLSDLLKNAKRLGDKKDELQKELAELLTKHEEHLNELRRVFNGMVKQVLSSPYSGNIFFKNGELEFHITHGTTLAGEAIDTLAVLLTDVCALLMGTIGKGSHPSFLIHDSPREADLGPRIYSSFLKRMAGFSNQSGGSSTAPFQYILTTTTAPPKDMKGEKFVRLRLCAQTEEDLLFRKNLGTIEDSQGEKKLPFEPA